MVASRKRCIEEHKVLIASSRILKDFVKACSKISPSASKVFWIRRFKISTYSSEGWKV
jgi:hypothetical protein